MQNVNQKSAKVQWMDWIKFIPVILFAGISPLVLHFKQTKYPNLAEQKWLPSGFMVNDIFNYYKAQTLLIAGGLALVFLIGYIVLNGLKKHKVYIPLGLFALFIVLSAFLSTYPDVAWNGYPEKMQGTYMWLTYIIMIVYVSQIIESKSDKIRLIRILQFSGVFIVGIGFFQAIGLDFFKTDLGARFLLGSKIYNQYSADVVSFKFEKYMAYSTLYNPNFVGSYVSMFVPFSVFGYITEENKILKNLWPLMAVGSIVMLIGSRSRAGFIGTGVAIVTLILWWLLKERKNAKRAVLIVLGVAAVGFIADIGTGQTFSSHLLSSFKTIQIDKSVDSIDMDGNRIEIVLEGGKVIRAEYAVEGEDVHAEFRDSEGISYSVLADQAGYYHMDGIENVRFTFGKVENINFITFDIDGVRWDFASTSDGVKFINPMGRLSDIVTTKSDAWDGLETLGSNRGYIWSRTLPLSKQSLFVGTGPDTFALEFPQTDYVNKENLYQSRSIVVDKAHNGYLAMALEMGWAAVVFFIGMNVYLVLEGSKKRQIMPVATACVGLLVATVFNDFNIHTMFLYVVAVGALVALKSEVQSI